MTPEPAEAQPWGDGELARRIGQQDQRAFESLMRRNNRMLYRLARAILKDEAEAEDAVQEAYIAAFRNIGTFRGGARLSTGSLASQLTRPMRAFASRSAIT